MKNDLNTAKLLLKASRPMLWVLPVLMFVGGMKVSGAAMTNMAMVQLALLTFPYNLFLYGVNDVYDYESDRRNPRKGDMQGLKLKPKYHGTVLGASAIAALAIALSSGATMDMMNMLGASMLLLFSYAYSAEPLRLKTKPPLDSLSNGVIYCLGPVFMGFSYGGGLFDLTYKVYFVALCVMGTHAISTIFDYDSDRKAGDTTFAVKFGRRTAAVFGLATYAIAYLFAGVRTYYLRYLIVLGMAIAAYLSISPNVKMTRTALNLLKVVTLAFIFAALLYITGS